MTTWYSPPLSLSVKSTVNFFFRENCLGRHGERHSIRSGCGYDRKKCHSRPKERVPNLRTSETKGRKTFEVDEVAGDVLTFLLTSLR